MDLKPWHEEQTLYEEEFVCVVRSESPMTELSLADYVARPHILVSLRDDFLGIVDRRLAAQQQSRQVIWSTPHFMSVPFLLARADCVALLPKRMAEQCAKAMGLKLLPPPINIEGFTVSMIWHQRHTNSPQHQWLRQQIIQAVQDL